jgi:hypothetical protein
VNNYVEKINNLLERQTVWFEIASILEVLGLILICSLYNFEYNFFEYNRLLIFLERRSFEYNFSPILFIF